MKRSKITRDLHTPKYRQRVIEDKKYKEKISRIKNKIRVIEEAIERHKATKH